MDMTETMINRQMHQWNRLAEFLKREPESGDAAKMEEEFARRHPVICLSRDLGSGARGVAECLSRRLNYEIMGKRLIDDLAADIGVQRQLIDMLDERSRGTLNVMYESLILGKEIDNADYFRGLVRVVRAVALKGGAVILGRGGAYILGRDAGLNVLIVAERGLRVRRVMEYLKLEEDQARRMVEESDRGREGFLKRHFGVDAHDPTHFDLCVNTDRLSAEQAGELVIKALEMRGYEESGLRIGG